MENITTNALKVVIIDDDDVSNFIYRKVIENCHVSEKIRDFQRAQQALQYLIGNLNNAEDLPDLIFLDINMPIMNGWEFLEEYASKVWPDLPKRVVLCMLSSSVYKEDIGKAKQYKQVDEYISKPLTRDHVYMIVKKYFKISSIRNN